MEFTNLRSERKSLNDRNENFVSINDKLGGRVAHQKANPCPIFSIPPKLLESKKQKCGPTLRMILRHVMFSDF